MTNKHPIIRRQFMERSLLTMAGVGVGSAIAPRWLRGASRTDRDSSQRILVVIQLSGGNDGLNTVIPIRDEEYRKRRPKLAISRESAISLPQDLAFHPALKGLAGLLEQGHFSVVQGVGYQTPNRSHFESMDIWHTCSTKEQRGRTGWLGRCLDHQSASLANRSQSSTNESLANDSLALHLGAEAQPLALASLTCHVPSLSSIEQFRFQAAGEMASNMTKLTPSTKQDNELLDFVSGTTASALTASRRIEEALAKDKSNNAFPDSGLGNKLEVVGRLIKAGFETSIYYVTLDGFDTHAQQPNAHSALLMQWSEALTSLVNYLSASGDLERTLVMTFSEFGRRVAENASEGTDHGAAAPVFFAGSKLQSQIIGQHPSLTDLDDGDLKFHTDFRSVYATVLEDWLGCPAEIGVGKAYAKINLM
jgi:uncharacterized protein (DUF1501 family)